MWQYSQTTDVSGSVTKDVLPQPAHCGRWEDASFIIHHQVDLKSAFLASELAPTGHRALLVSSDN